MRIYQVILALFLVLPWELGAATDATQALQEYFNSVHTLTGRFVQETRAEDGSQIDASSGEFALARPNRFDWLYEKPYRQRILADGKRLWVYDVELRQVTVRALGEVLGVGPALLLSGRFSDLRRSFELHDLGAGWIRLLPKAGQWDFKQLRLHMAQGVPDIIEVDDGLGQTTHLELRDLKRNPVLNPQRFHFTPPPGVDVIRPDRKTSAPQ
ncbi:MAG TPA: outer membrane lipoprotein chaperone LolA [Nitrococcus sp.]|nr:outer membrane lipoprotein chaperone LolA [Nitrococcus sp.]